MRMHSAIIVLDVLSSGSSNTPETTETIKGFQGSCFLSLHSTWSLFNILIQDTITSVDDNNAGPKLQEVLTTEDFPYYSIR